MTIQARWPEVAGLAYGGDYNPEQWPRATWDEDMRLMREAGVTLVSVGIFSWAMLEPKEGGYTFGWLDEMLDLLHAHGIAADLGTPTASPPAWFFVQHPEARVVARDGRVMGFGSRGMASHSSPAYREASASIASMLAERYGDHPAVVMWHVHNEYGVPVGEDYSDSAAAAFREWLGERYGSLDNLNEAWGTAFWGQRYGEWSQVRPPADAPSVVNPAQRLDFARFTDHQLLACFTAERDAIRAIAVQPITTNFMVNASRTTDIWAWAREVDIVANDHYLTAADPAGHIELSLVADLTRSIAGGEPWILMEHSTSAVNWQPRNVAKRAGEMARNSLTHVARGADAVLFFQWRASRSGAEKFHSAMVPHAGTSSRIWREVVELGAAVTSLAPVKGSRVHADVAILWDTESFWAEDLDWRPTEGHAHKERIRAFYERMWRDGVTTDFAHPGQDLSGYKLVVVPALYLLRADHARRLNEYVAKGGTLVVSYFSGIVDENDAVHAGGFGAPLKEALGLTVDEFLPLREGESGEIRFANADRGSYHCDVWQEDLALAGADVVAMYTDGPGLGGAAITRNAHGDGHGWYVSTRLGVEELAAVMRGVYADAGIAIDPPAEGLEVVTRHGADGDFVFAINHSSHDARCAATGTDLLSGAPVDGHLDVPAGSVAVVQSIPLREGGDSARPARSGAVATST